MRAWAVGAVAALLAGCGAPELTPEQEAERATAGACIVQIKRQMHNPDSLKWDYSTTKYVHHDEGVTLNRAFTATNGFGGTIRSVMQCTYDPQRQRLVALDVF